MMDGADRFQEHLGLHFSNPNLLIGALTHSSYVNEQQDAKLEHNERLEFLGDAVLDLLVGEMLFQRIPDASEGYLTRLRAALVRTETLAELAAAVQLGEHLLMGRGEEETGGRGRVGNLCAAFEALVGAIYLDSGLETARLFVLPLLEQRLDGIIELDLDKDPKSKLQEYCQARWGTTPKYQTISSTGPEHKKEFAVEVAVLGKVVGKGAGPSKQIAAQAAARSALELFHKGSETHSDAT